MARIDVIRDTLQQRVDAGILTLEDANKVYSVAYAKYLAESDDDNEKPSSGGANYSESEESEAKADGADNVDKNDTKSKKELDDSAIEVKQDMDKGPDTSTGPKDVQEEIKELKLATYEAADMGVISEETKRDFLAHLDLSNYE